MANKICCCSFKAANSASCSMDIVWDRMIPAPRTKVSVDSVLLGSDCIPKDLNQNLTFLAVYINCQLGVKPSTGKNAWMMGNYAGMTGKNAWIQKHKNAKKLKKNVWHQFHPFQQLKSAFLWHKVQIHILVQLILPCKETSRLIIHVMFYPSGFLNILWNSITKLLW